MVEAGKNKHKIKNKSLHCMKLKITVEAGKIYKIKGILIASHAILQ